MFRMGTSQWFQVRGPVCVAIGESPAICVQCGTFLDDEGDCVFCSVNARPNRGRRYLEGSS